MKLIIEESRRDQLTKKQLDKEFSNLYQEKNYYTDSTGEQWSISYRNNDDDVIMVYGDKTKVLYICDDITQPLLPLSYTPHEIKKIVGGWFSDKFGLPLKHVHHTNKETIN